MLDKQLVVLSLGDFVMLQALRNLSGYCCKRLQVVHVVLLQVASVRMLTQPGPRSEQPFLSGTAVTDSAFSLPPLERSTASFGRYVMGQPQLWLVSLGSSSSKCNHT